MKKILMTAAVLACAASIVSAQTVTSANVVGYSKVTMEPGFNMIRAAFLAGGALTTVTTLALWLMSLTGSIAAPNEETIVAGVTGLVASLFGAAGAYIASNSEPERPDVA